KLEIKVKATVGKPQVSYRETIHRKIESGDYTHKKQTGRARQFGTVIVTVESLESEQGEIYEVNNAITRGRSRRDYRPSVDHGIQEAMQFGVLGGYPMVGVKAPLEDGAYHDVDSSEMAFKLAGSQVFKEGIKRAKPVLLEPVMAV